MNTTQCRGFGEYEGKCTNQANGERGNPWWCDRCDRLRCEHITSRLQALASRVEHPSGWPRDRYE